MGRSQSINASSPSQMGILQATASYEHWLSTFAPIVRSDLMAKHQALAEDPFAFLRGTFYRWVQLWPSVCEDLADAPAILAVGDLHVENFGTWRDAEGRLAWGVNDFDEAAVLPYTNDLTRLATSVLLAIDGEHLSMDPKEAIDAVLDGYTSQLKAGGEPIVIDENHRWFVPLLEKKNKNADPATFWQKLREIQKAAKPTSAMIPSLAKTALKQRLPEGSQNVVIAARRAGVGSLGKPRYLATAQWTGAPVAREIKTVMPSACVWAKRPDKPANDKSKIPQLMASLISNGLRCSDPFYHVDDRWISRRIAPDSRKIEISASPSHPDEIRMLEAMGKETANVHLGTPRSGPAILKDLKARKKKWLYRAATAMRIATLSEHKIWAMHQSE